MLADHVEGATRIATAIQAAGRATDDFQALDRIGVWRIGVPPVDREPVAVVLAGGEAAHRESGKALAAEVVGAADAAGIIEPVLQTGGAGILEDILGYHANGLRRLVQCRVSARGTGRAAGLVPLDRAVGPFGIGTAGNAQGLKFDLRGVGRGGRIGKRQGGNGMKYTKRDERATHRQYDPE